MLSKKRNNRNNLKSRKYKKVSKSRKQNSRSKVLKTRKNILRGGATITPVTNIPHYTEPHQGLPPLPYNNNPPPRPRSSLKNQVPVNLNITTHMVPSKVAPPRPKSPKPII